MDDHEDIQGQQLAPAAEVAKVSGYSFELTISFF